MWGPNASSGKMDDKRSLSQLGTNKFAVLSTSNIGSSGSKGSSMEKDGMNSFKLLDGKLT